MTDIFEPEEEKLEELEQELPNNTPDIFEVQELEDELEFLTAKYYLYKAHKMDAQEMSNFEEEVEEFKNKLAEVMI